MLDTLKPYFDNYSKIKKAYVACNTFSYKASPHLLIPRFVKHPPKLIDKKSHLLIQAEDRAPLIIPVTLDSPSKFYGACINTIEEYGGVFDISKPYADALTKKGFIARKRPWGHMDFVFETSHLATMLGGKLKKTRNELSKLTRAGVTVRPLTLDDMPKIEALEKLWAEQKVSSNNHKIGNQGYLSEFLRYQEHYPDSFSFNCIGVFFEGAIISMAAGCALSDKVWCCGYRYGNRDYASVLTYAFKEISQAYKDYSFECDGDAGAATTGIFHYKQKFLTEPMFDQQQYKYVVSKK